MRAGADGTAFVLQVRDQHAESRRSAETKMDHMQIGAGKDVGTQATGRTTKEVAKLKGTSAGGEAKKDQELVLYEFLNLLVRIRSSHSAKRAFHD